MRTRGGHHAADVAGYSRLMGADEKSRSLLPAHIAVSRSGKSAVTHRATISKIRNAGTTIGGTNHLVAMLLSGSRKTLAFAVVGEIWPSGELVIAPIGTIA